MPRSASLVGTTPCIAFVLAFGWLLAIPAPCAEAPLDFAVDLYPRLESKNCRACHNTSGVASGTRLQFPEIGAPIAAIQRFGLGLKRLVDQAAIGQSALLLKPTNKIPHTGGPLIAADSEEERLLRRWVEYLASQDLEDESVQNAPPERRFEPIRRLTHAQYDNTVQDLLGDSTRPSRNFPSEDYVNGYTNQASAQVITPAMAELYGQVAERLGRNAFRYGDEGGLLPCKPRSPADRACAQAFVVEFGAKAFRRPLTDSEREAHVDLLLQWATQAESFDSGAAAVIEAMLQSPHFLFLVPHANDSPAKPFEIASRLAYALWNAPPDQELLAAATAGALDTRSSVDAHSRHMLASMRARETFDDFLAQWMRFDRLRNSVKDRNRFRDFGPEVAESMTEETRRLFQHLAWNDLDFRGFFTADYTFADDFLTKVYGMSEPSVPFGKTAYPADSTRSGILGHGTFLAQTGKPIHTSPTERGLFVREHFLCQTIPPPPPGVDTSLPPLTLGGRPMTIRETMEELHAAQPVCASCHKLVDPIGYGFEHFDTVGAYRETEPVRVEPTPQQKREGTEATDHSLPIDSTGFVAGITDSAFESPRDVGRILAQSPICQKCIARQLFRYLFGRSETSRDAQVIERAYNRFERSGFVFRELVLGLVVTEEFLATDWSD